MQPIHSFTIKATSIVAGPFPDDLKHQQQTSEQCYFTDLTRIFLADYVDVQTDHNFGHHIVARKNDGATCFVGDVGATPFNQSKMKQGSSELLRVVVENPNGKTSHIIARPLLPDKVIPSIKLNEGERAEG